MTPMREHGFRYEKERRGMMFTITPRSMTAEQMTDMTLCMPRDAVILDVRVDFLSMRVGVLVGSEFFDPLDDKDCIPVVPVHKIPLPMDAYGWVHYRCEWRWCK